VVQLASVDLAPPVAVAHDLALPVVLALAVERKREIERRTK
jgi:hypothetical protein